MFQLDVNQHLSQTRAYFKGFFDILGNFFAFL